jgi:hypothetical protein
MALSEWKNGITDTSSGHDMRLPFADYVGLFQARHYVFLNYSLGGAGGGGLGIGNKDFVRGFKYQLWEGDQLSFEAEFEITFNLTFFATGGFGFTTLAFVIWSIKREKIKTTVINGEPTSPVVIVNTQSTSGAVFDYDGNAISNEEAAKLENPSWIHTLGGQRTSEYGNLILDFDTAAFDNVAILSGRYEMPVYRQSAGPDTQVDIVFDSLSAAGRADLYQFRAGGTATSEEIKAAMDEFMGLAIPSLQGGNAVLLRYGGKNYINLDTRALIQDVTQPSVNIDGSHQFWLGVLDEEAGIYEERLSRDTGHRFYKLARDAGTIWKGKVTMPYEITIDPTSGERGAVAYEGQNLKYKRSGDNWSSAVTIATLSKPTPMALSVDSAGVLRVGDGAGLQWVSFDRGARWKDESVVLQT